MSALKPIRKIGSIKREIRLLALNGIRAPSSKAVWFLGVVFRGGIYLDGVMTVKTSDDVAEGTEQLIQMILQSKHYDEIRAIVLDKTLFDVLPIDLKRLFERTRKPMVVVLDDSESGERSEKLSYGNNTTLGLLSNFEECQLDANGHRIRLRVAGITPEMAISMIRKTSKKDFIPEAMKVARIVSSAFLEMLQTDQKV